MKSETKYMAYKPLLRTSKIKMATITFEYVLLVGLLPLAMITYQVLNLLTTVPALVLPFILFIYVGLAFLNITPSQYLTTVGIIFELTGITIFGLFYDFADLRTPTFVILLTFGTFVFWVLSVYILLSVRGVKQEEMGRLGEMANGVSIVANGVGDIANGVGVIANGVGIIFCGGGDPQEERVQACRASYQLSPFSDMSNSNKPPRDSLVGIMCCGDGGGNVGPPPYHFSPDSDMNLNLSKPSVV